MLSGLASTPRGRRLVILGASFGGISTGLAVRRQVPDAEKRRRADFVVDTGTSHAETEAEVGAIIARLEGETGTALDRYWR